MTERVAMRCALITGVAGEALSQDEVAFLRLARPCGLILFARNCRAIDQIRRLVGDVKAAIGSTSLLVLIDQEGGRVQRLRPPQWRELPSAAAPTARHPSKFRTWDGPLPKATCPAACYRSLSIFPVMGARWPIAMWS